MDLKYLKSTEFVSGYIKGVVFDDETKIPLEANFELIELSKSETVVNSFSDLENGINKNRLESKGYGSSKLVDTNQTEEGKANNRRTEVKVVGC